LPITPDAFYEKQFLSVESMTFSTLIQTNKATYRPGEKIKYRVILLDADTRPVNVQDSLTISLIDSSQNVIELLANRSTVNGVYSGGFQTSESDETGTYEIETECKQKVRLTIRSKPSPIISVFRKQKKPLKSAMQKILTSTWPLPRPTL
jgi:CD109 antigen